MSTSEIATVLAWHDALNTADLDTLVAGLHRFQFHFVNAGDEDLIFEFCKTSCGCLVASCPSEPIPPGAKGEIDVAYNTVGKSGPQQKSITISTNDRQRPIRAIRVVAYIVPLPAQPAEFLESPPASK